jgi:hypothetical protein
MQRRQLLSRVFIQEILLFMGLAASIAVLLIPLSGQVVDVLYRSRLKISSCPTLENSLYSAALGLATGGKKG